jgi:outer membrane protein assembly factor BamB
MTDLRLLEFDWKSEDARALDRVRQRVAAAPAAPNADVVVAVAGREARIVGLPLGAGPRWVFPHALDARPTLTGNVVVSSGSNEVFALDALTGDLLWRRRTGGLAMRGAGDDGSVTVISFSQATGNGSTLLAIHRDGSIVRQVETDKSLGVPAVVAGLAFVPWDGRYISVIDLSDGNESARLTLPEKTSHAWTWGGTVFFGERGFYRFDSQVPGDPAGTLPHVGLPPRPLPTALELMPPGNERLPPVANVKDRARLYAAPTAAVPLSLQADRFYASYFKLIVGFEGERGALSWVRTHAADDVLGGAAAPWGFLACDARGKVMMLDATSGAVRATRDLGEPVQSCVVQVDRFRPSAEGSPTVPPTPAAASGVTWIPSAQEALSLGGPELLPMQRVLVRELAAHGGERGAKVLAGLASDPRTHPVLVAEARAALRNGDPGKRSDKETPRVGQ